MVAKRLEPEEKPTAYTSNILRSLVVGLREGRTLARSKARSGRAANPAGLQGQKRTSRITVPFVEATITPRNTSGFDHPKAHPVSLVSRRLSQEEQISSNNICTRNMGREGRPHQIPPDHCIPAMGRWANCSNIMI
jgi:hypothetical protein